MLVRDDQVTEGALRELLADLHAAGYEPERDGTVRVAQMDFPTIAEKVIVRARDRASPLHNLFEWRNERAAALHRQGIASLVLDRITESRDVMMRVLKFPPAMCQKNGADDREEE